jgi:hypothetical protein
VELTGFQDYSIDSENWYGKCLENIMYCFFHSILKGESKMKKIIFFLVMLVISIGTATANASLINFDNLTSFQDVGGSYSSLGVRFTPSYFTILTQSQSLNPLAISPSFPNVAFIPPPNGATISFDTPQSSVSFKYGIISGLNVTASGPNFFQSFSDSVSSFPNINKIITFTASQPSITSLSFNQNIVGDTVIDDLVFSSVSGSQRAKDIRAALGNMSLGLVAFSVAGLVAALPTAGISTFALVGEVGSMMVRGLTLALLEDPFDPNYSQKFVPVFRQFPLLQADATLPQSLADEANAVFTNCSKAISFLQASYVSLNRLNSATQVGDQASIDLQRSAVDTYLALASSELDQYSRGLKMLSADLSAMGLDIAITLDQINTFLDDLRTQGFAALPQQEQALFDLYGFDSAFRQSVIDELLSLNPSDVPQSFVLALSMDATGMGDLSAVYAGPSAAVPEPSTMVLIGSGLLGLAGYGRKKFFKK